MPRIYLVLVVYLITGCSALPTKSKPESVGQLPAGSQRSPAEQIVDANDRLRAAIMLTPASYMQPAEDFFCYAADNCKPRRQDFSLRVMLSGINGSLNDANKLNIRAIPIFKALGARNAGIRGGQRYRLAGDIPYFDSRVFLGEAVTASPFVLRGSAMFDLKFSISFPPNTIGNIYLALDVAMPDGTLSGLIVSPSNDLDYPMCAFDSVTGNEISPTNIAGAKAYQRWTESLKDRKIDSKKCPQ